jgi:hypothetical protein
LAFTVTFPTNRALPAPAEIAGWLTEQGEPYDAEGPAFALTALPVRIVVGDGLQAWVEVTADAALARLVDLLFALSVHAGADVRLAGVGPVSRASLWMRLADEQDRVRIGAALAEAEVHGNATEVGQRLWAIVSAIGPGRDLRWDVAKARIVEIVEVGAGISEAEAGFLVEGARSGDVVARPVDGYVHILAWRWLSEAYPGLTEL